MGVFVYISHFLEGIMKLNFFYHNIVFIFLSVVLASCSSIATSTQQLPTEIISTPVLTKETAFTAYQIAEVRALEWNPKAKLYRIPIKTIMASNLGIPPSDKGWYFMFSEENNPLEFYIEVINGSVTGYTEAQPILIEELPYELLPISISNLIDSDVVLEIFTKEFPEKDLTSIELSLVHIKGTNNPSWIIYSTKDKNSPIPLMYIDALTKDKVDDPYENSQ